MPSPPKKRFSQNFLRDSRVVDKILAAAELDADDRVLEIGPGRGILTRRLVETCREVHVIEIDRELVHDLRAQRPSHLHVHEGDALKMDWKALLGVAPWKLVANLPYHISSPLFFKILENRKLFRLLILMFQKEFGERLAALPGTKDYGIPSVFCRQYFDVTPVATVSPASFHPAPRVHSIVLCLRPFSTPRVPVADEKLFARVVRGAFAQRRKTLHNSLRSYGFPAESLAKKITASGIDPETRGETLTLEDFCTLTQVLADDLS